MKASYLFGETLREAPADANWISHQLLLRAGYIRELAPGLFSLLPLAWRSIRKIRQIIRDEIEAIGGQEVYMPLIQPADIRQQSSRLESMNKEPAKFKDQRGRKLVLAPSHEEAAALLAASEIHSYRQLPQLMFQFQLKYRDEAFPRGGLLRAREFITMDAYSFDRDEPLLQKHYQGFYNTFSRIAARVGLPLLAVPGDSGSAEENQTHKFMYLTPNGEDSAVICKHCGYAAKPEAAEFIKEPFGTESAKPLKKVFTPGTASIEALSEFLGIQKQQTAKAVFYIGEFGEGQSSKIILAIVRGDMEANENRIKKLAEAKKLRPAEAEEIEAAGCAPGFASPIGINRKKSLVIVDELVTESANLVTGANEEDYHLLNSNCYRDYQPDIVGNIATAYEGAPCIKCRNPLDLLKGVEVASLHQFSTYFTEIFKAEYLDEQGKSRPMRMGAYGIGLGRLLACIAEEHHDEYGLSLPISVAPYQVVLLTLKGEETVKKTADTLYKNLADAGIEVLYDERDLSPGIKFNDADLRGIPLRLTISERSLKNGGVEFKLRTAKDRIITPVDEVTSRMLEEINNRKADILK
jgi:prolyl-tRNA synthetase